MIKRYLNRALDLAFIRPILPLWAKRNQSKSMILLYHRIDGDGEYPFLDLGGNPNTAPDQFRQDIKLLKGFGAKFKTVSQLLENQDINSFNIAICIDDGFKSNYKIGVDICESENVPQTILQCSSMLNTRPLIWEHRLYFLYFHPIFGDKLRSVLDANGLSSCLDQLRFSLHPNRIVDLVRQVIDTSMDIEGEFERLAAQLYPSTEDLKELVSIGSELGSHGADHWPRSSISEAEFEAQLAQSKIELEKIVGQNVDSFSYPFNDYYAEDLELCKRYYKNVFSVEPGFLTYPDQQAFNIPRNTYPGPAKNALRHRRWLLTGRI